MKSAESGGERERWPRGNWPAVRGSGGAAESGGERERRPRGMFFVSGGEGKALRVDSF